MNRKIILMGKMGKIFGREHKLNVDTVQEAIHALDCIKGGVRKYVLECQDKGIHFSVQKGSEVLKNTEANAEHFLDGEELQGDEGRGLDLESNDIIITPIPSGAGLGDVFKVILGVILIVTGVYMYAKWGMALWQAMAVASFGVMLATAGIVEMMIGDDPEDLNDDPSKMFNGPVNRTKSGIPVPLAYGKIMAGWAVTNFGFTNQRVKSSTGYTFISKSSQDGNYDGNTGGGGMVGDDSNDDNDTQYEER